MQVQVSLCCCGENLCPLVCIESERERPESLLNTPLSAKTLPSGDSMN